MGTRSGEQFVRLDRLGVELRLPHSSIRQAVFQPTVRQRLEDYAKKVGFGLLIANFSVGNAPREYTEKSMRLFAEKVMPKLRHINVDATSADAS